MCFACVILTVSTALCRPAVLDVPAKEVLAAVNGQYAIVSNLTCTVRREATDGSGRKIELMSRVAWARGDRMNVQMLKPIERRIVIDGVTVQMKTAANQGPLVNQVTNQTPSQVANLRSVPGSPEEMLAPFADMSASDRPAKSPLARTVAFSSTEKDGRAVIVAAASFDELGRVACIDFFPDGPDDAEHPRSSAFFRGAFEALPDVWLFHRVETETTLSGRTIKTVSRFDKFEVNGDLPASIFDPKAFF
jgi:outer membrane lipoprotein-sorting protein